MFGRVNACACVRECVWVRACVFECESVCYCNGSLCDKENEGMSERERERVCVVIKPKTRT